LITVN